MMEMKKALLVAFVVLALLVIVAAEFQTVNAQDAPSGQLTATILPSFVDTYWIHWGQTVQFTAIATGGTPPYRYQWYTQVVLFLPPYCWMIQPIIEVADGTSQNFTFIPTRVSSFDIFVVVKDSLNAQVNSSKVSVGIIGPSDPDATLLPYPSPSSNSSPTPTSSPSPSMAPSITPTPSQTPSTSPSSSSTQQPSMEPSSSANPPLIVDHFPNYLFLILLGIIAIVIVAALGALVYFKKRKRS